MTIYHFKAPLDKAAIDTDALTKISSVENTITQMDLFCSDQMNMAAIHEEVAMDAFYEFRRNILIPKIIDIAGSGPVDLAWYNEDEIHEMSTLETIEQAWLDEQDDGWDGCTPLDFMEELHRSYESYQYSPQFMEEYDVVFVVFDPRVAMILKLEGYEEVPNPSPKPKKANLNDY